MRAEIAIVGEERRDMGFEACSGAKACEEERLLYSAVLMDMSQRGFRAAVDGLIPAHSKIAVKVGACPPLTAQVSWVSNGVLGCEFTDALSNLAVIDKVRSEISLGRLGRDAQLERTGRGR